MADNTHIEWTDATWSPVTGCTKISPGCEHCYIERTPPFRMTGRRFDRPGIGGTTGVMLHPDRLDQPTRWRKPHKVFVCSMADLFHADVPDAYIARVWAVMALAPRHTFQVLTKRPGRMRPLLSSDRFRDAVAHECDVLNNTATELPGLVDHFNWPLPNVWLGVSTETQQWADIRIPDLLGTPAAVRWISAEPLLGPIDLAWWLADTYTCRDEQFIHWVVGGGESGPGARPMDPDWARGLRDQCSTAEVAFLFKQWGEHDANGRRVGKRAAGRVLDGRLWDEYPHHVAAHTT